MIVFLQMSLKNCLVIRMLILCYCRKRCNLSTNINEFEHTTFFDRWNEEEDCVENGRSTFWLINGWLEEKG